MEKRAQVVSAGEREHVIDGEWVSPATNPFGHVCCDCGLGHMVEYALVDALSGQEVAMPAGAVLVLKFNRDAGLTGEARTRWINYEKLDVLRTTPQVPRYERTVQTDPLRTPTAQGVGPAAFGGGLAAGISSAARDLEAIAREQREKADRTATVELMTGLDGVEAALSQGERDAQGQEVRRGFLVRKGKEAVETDPATVLQDYDTRAAALKARLGTDEQRAAADLLIAQRKGQLNLQLQRHIAAETRRYQVEVDQAKLDSGLNRAINSFQDPEAVKAELQTGAAVILSDTSASPEEIETRLGAWRSSVHGSIVERIANDDPQQAQEYFAANKDAIVDAKVRGRLEKMLEPLVDAQRGSTIAGEVFARAGDSGSLLDMLQEVREKHANDPEVRKHAEVELRGLYSAREEEKRQEIDTAERAVTSAIAKAVLAGRTPTRKDVPNHLWNRLAGVAPERVVQLVDNMAQRQERGVSESQETLTTWGELKRNPERLRSVNLDALLVAGQLSPRHYQDLIGDQVAINQGKGERELTLRSDKAVIDTVLKSAGITASKNPDRYDAFHDELNNRMQQFKAEHGKVPNQAEKEALARGLLATVAQDVSWWPLDRDVAAFEADPERVVIPDADRAAIAERLRVRGLDASDENVRRVYLNAKSRGQ